MADFKAAQIFSDNMVLQYLKPINVFGTGKDGAELTVGITGQEAAIVTCTVKDGRWLAVLPPQPAQKCVELSVSDGRDTVVYKNVAVGAVWLAGGQSNMELELQNCSTGQESLASDKPDVRFYYTQKYVLADETFMERESHMAWSTFDNKESAKAWSAVGYYFAKELSEEWGMTVGVIGCNWGGTSASAWMDRSYADGCTSVYFEEYDAAVAGKTTEQLLQEYKDYQEYHTAWEKKSAKYYSTTPDPDWDGCLAYCGPNKYPGPASPLNPMSPSILHDSMVQRVAPYTMTGVIWYQGESDDHRPEMYEKLLTQMIQNWRDDWNDEELFFVIGQLPMHRWSGEEDRKHWCLIREAQARVAKRDRHASLAILTDCGEFNEIHPKNKKLAGHRFLLSALNSYYECGMLNEQEICTDNADAYQVCWNGDSADVFITCAYGLEIRGESGEIHGFELAGEDGVFHPAKAEIADRKLWNGEVGSEVIHVSGVDKPCAVRYLWTNYTDDITLFDEENGVPLPPFRFMKPSFKG